MSALRLRLAFRHRVDVLLARPAAQATLVAAGIIIGHFLIPS